MLLRWYAAVSFGLVASYLLVPYDWRGVPFLLVSMGAIPAALIGARRCPPGARLPWWLLLGSLVFFNAGNLVWIYYATYTDRVTGDGSFADLLFAVAALLTLGASLVVVIRRGRRDVGGLLDAVVTALAVGSVLWTAVLMPFLRAAEAPMSRQVALFSTVLLMTGALGGMLRVSLTASRRIAATWLLAAGLALSLVGHVVVTLFTDPATQIRPDWTNLAFLAAYAVSGCAALHPSAAMVTRPDAAPDDYLSTARLAFLGCMTAVIPLIGGGRDLLDLPADGLLMAFGSILVTSLVMIRIARLSAQRRRAEHALHKMATSDALTGLPNRTACLARVSEELAEPGLAVLFCDLDGFKPVNDRLGHAAGDTLLVVVADRLRAAVREPDMVSRFGGDEFVIVCRGADPGAAVDSICERVRTAIESPVVLGDEPVWVGLSVGVAYATSGSTTDELIGRADLAMYRAKQSKAVGRLSLAGR